MIINILTECSRCGRQNILTMDKVAFIGYEDKTVEILTKQKCKCGANLAEYFRKAKLNIEKEKKAPFIAYKAVWDGNAVGDNKIELDDIDFGELKEHNGVFVDGYNFFRVKEDKGELNNE